MKLVPVLLFWTSALVVGLFVAIVASGRALDAGVSLAERAGLSPFLVGMTVMAVGTDLPEIANSITASATGHGDVNVGDSVGSVVTQMTFVLGILCLVRGVRSERRLVLITGGATVVALALATIVVSDGDLSRLDGLMLIAAWGVGTYVVQSSGHMERSHQARLFTQGAIASAATAVVALSFVGGGAVVAVVGFTEAAAILGLPEYATSFFALSIGTSLPELVVDGRALKQGLNRLALGDLLGSSFVDATLSLGIGPAMFPTMLSGDVLRGTTAAAVIVGASVIVLASSTSHRWRSGSILLALYGSLYVWILVP